jgi:hypothetical protein
MVGYWFAGMGLMPYPPFFIWKLAPRCRSDSAVFIIYQTPHICQVVKFTKDPAYCFL